MSKTSSDSSTIDIYIILNSKFWTIYPILGLWSVCQIVGLIPKLCPTDLMPNGVGHDIFCIPNIEWRSSLRPNYKFYIIFILIHHTCTCHCNIFFSQVSAQYYDFNVNLCDARDFRDAIIHSRTNYCQNAHCRYDERTWSSQIWTAILPWYVNIFFLDRLIFAIRIKIPVGSESSKLSACKSSYISRV